MARDPELIPLDPETSCIRTTAPTRGDAGFAGGNDEDLAVRALGH